MVRDIDKLRSKSEFRLGPGHMVLIVGATAAAAGLLFAAVNAVASGRGDAAPGVKDDPLAALEATVPAKTAEAPAAVPVRRPPEIEPLGLSFHERLAVGRAQAGPPPAPSAAVLDDATAPLSPDEPVVAGPAPAASPKPIAPPAHHNTPVLAQARQAVPEPARPDASPPAAAAMPPPVGAHAAAPLPPGDPVPLFDEEPVPDAAQPGEDGIFTLQVASFATHGEAVAFMNVLRQRGHGSFLVRADGGDRGTIWRVRVGPFPSQRDAERYRRTFERSERIPTFVVRRWFQPVS